jgi:hypothetical protein
MRLDHVKDLQKKHKEVENFKKHLKANNAKPFHPNSNTYRSYMDKLSSLVKLIPFQLYAGIGLILSDASIQFNASKTACRIKMQQGAKNLDFITFVLVYVWTVWCVQDNPQAVSEARKDMSEIQTVNHPILLVFAVLFLENGKKVIKSNIGRYLTPVTIAFWFMGDGGKMDYGANKGKGIDLHTQGFTQEEVELLAEELRKRYGWDVHAHEVKSRKYLVRISGTSYDSFIPEPSLGPTGPRLGSYKEDLGPKGPKYSWYCGPLHSFIYDL